MDGYMGCAVYAAHGACSCSTGVPGIVCPLRVRPLDESDIEEGSEFDGPPVIRTFRCEATTVAPNGERVRCHIEPNHEGPHYALGGVVWGDENLDVLP